MIGNIFLEIPKDVYSSLRLHLLSDKTLDEQAAFAFVRQVNTGGCLTFQFLEWQPLYPSDFESQFEDYLELADHARARIIKRAHDLGSSLVEFHSHPHSKSASFSVSDRIGFEEFVPHIWWRLRGKPYLAVVVSKKSFDVLVWTDDPLKPQKLDAIKVGEDMLYPTGHTIRYMEASHGRTL